MLSVGTLHQKHRSLVCGLAGAEQALVTEGREIHDGSVTSDEESANGDHHRTRSAICSYLTADLIGING
jgi:hypothetical protein